MSISKEKVYRSLTLLYTMHLFFIANLVYTLIIV